MFEQELVYKIRGVAFDIFNNVAGSWSEENYEEILFNSLVDQGLKVEQQKEFTVFYKGNRVGLYRTDLIIDDKIILELKVVSEIFSLHEAQIISYLKITGFRLAMLINFGGSKIFIKAYPNKFINYKNNANNRILVKNIPVVKTNIDDIIKNSYERQLIINFDIDKLNLSAKDKKIIQPFLMFSKEILEILGPGYFHQVYRRAFWDELKYHNINFEWIKQLELNYKGRVYDSKEVKFFKINDLLISAVAVNNLNDLVVNRFSKYIKHYKCNKGLIVNFNNTMVDFRYF